MSGPFDARRVRCQTEWIWETLESCLPLLMVASSRACPYLRFPMVPWLAHGATDMPQAPARLLLPTLLRLTALSTTLPTAVPRPRLMPCAPTSGGCRPGALGPPLRPWPGAGSARSSLQPTCGYHNATWGAKGGYQCLQGRSQAGRSAHRRG